MDDKQTNPPERPPFDIMAELAKLDAEEPRRAGPKLSRTEQYQAFAVLKSGHFSHGVVGKMFGLSAATVSHIANCTRRTAGTVWRYPAIFIEWRRLGGDAAFMHEHMTEDLWLKAKRLKYEAAEPLDDRRKRGPSRGADKYVYDNIGFFEVSDWLARIDWVECDPETPAELRGPVGWRYATKSPGFDLTPYYSREPTETEPRWMPWATSGEAFDAAYQAAGLISPRRGRNAR